MGSLFSKRKGGDSGFRVAELSLQRRKWLHMHHILRFSLDAEWARVDSIPLVGRLAGARGLSDFTKNAAVRFLGAGVLAPFLSEPGPCRAQYPGSGPASPRISLTAHMAIRPIRDTISGRSSYATAERPGTIIIETRRRFLYFVLGDGKAFRYGIGVGRYGFTWRGTERVTRKAEWPDWRPPKEMLARDPDLPDFMEGGPKNPLGARASISERASTAFTAPRSPGRSDRPCHRAASGSPMTTSSTSTIAPGSAPK